MESLMIPNLESKQLGGHLLARHLITLEQLDAALEEQQRRPFLHLGEILCLMGALSYPELSDELGSFQREGRLGSLLLSRGQITLSELGAALERQLVDSRPIGEILMEHGHLTSEALQAALEAHADRPASSGDLFTKCRKTPTYQAEEDRGHYPFFQPLQAGESPTTRMNGRDVILLAANSYLGLSTDPDVIRASMEATERYGVGTSGSPLLNGTMDLHVELSQRLASFMDKEACALFSTGFQTNLGAIAALVGPTDVVLVDSLAHASIFDGCQLSAGETKRFNHNNMAHLEELLRQSGSKGKLIVIDGVYSMDGDLADLPNIVRLAKAYGAKILLDDAHGFGILGARGRGTAEYYGLLNEVDLVMLTFSKALGTIGGCVLGNREVIRYLKHRSRPLIFSASLPPGTVGATLASLQRIMTDRSLQQRLAANVQYLRMGLVERGFRVGPSHSQIQTVHIGDEQLALRMGSELIQEGVLAATVLRPAVPPGQARFRVSVMATHTVPELQLALEAFERVGRRLGVI